MARHDSLGWVILAAAAVIFSCGGGGEEQAAGPQPKPPADTGKAPTQSAAAVKSVASIAQSTSAVQSAGKIQGQAGQRGGTHGGQVSGVRGGVRGASGGGQPVPGAPARKMSTLRTAAKRSHTIPDFVNVTDPATGETYVERCVHPSGATGTGTYLHQTLFQDRTAKYTWEVETGVVGQADCDLVGKFEGTKAGASCAAVLVTEDDFVNAFLGQSDAAGCKPKFTVTGALTGATCDPTVTEECFLVDANEWDDPDKSDLNDLKKIYTEIVYKDGSGTWTNTVSYINDKKYQSVDKWASQAAADDTKEVVETTEIETAGLAEDFIVGLVLDDLTNDIRDVCADPPAGNTVIPTLCGLVSSLDQTDDDEKYDDLSEQIGDKACEGTNPAKVAAALPAVKGFCNLWTNDVEDGVTKWSEKVSFRDGTVTETAWTPAKPCATLDDKSANFCDYVDGTEAITTTFPAGHKDGIKSVAEKSSWTYAAGKGTDAHAEDTLFANGDKYGEESTDAYTCIDAEQCEKSSGKGTYKESSVSAGKTETSCGTYTWDDSKGEDFGSFTNVDSFADGSVMEETESTTDAFTGKYGFKTYDKGTADCTAYKAVAASDGKQTDGYDVSWTKKEGVQFKLSNGQTVTRTGVFNKFTDFAKNAGEYVTAVACENPAEDAKAQTAEDWENPAALGPTCFVVNEGSGKDKDGNAYTFREQKAAGGSSDITFSWKSADGTSSATGTFGVDPRGVSKGEYTEAGATYTVTLNKDGSGEICEKGQADSCVKLSPGDFVL